MNKIIQDSDNFFLIAGPCAIESLEHCLSVGKEIKRICQDLNIPYIFKASFDKANRTSIDSYRGVGLEKGLEILKIVKETLNVPVLTDIHEPFQCQPVAEVCDILQIPAFLCRQTDLLVAAGKTGKIINVKKGQFCSHTTMKHANDKVLSTGNHNVILTDRGTMFGYGDLVVDFRNLVRMKTENPNALIVQDCTHSLQQPNQANTTLGLREFVPTICKAAVATGVDGLFLEVHDCPEQALSDASTQFPLSKLESLLKVLISIHQATRLETIG